MAGGSRARRCLVQVAKTPGALDAVAQTPIKKPGTGVATPLVPSTPAVTDPVLQPVTAETVDTSPEATTVEVTPEVDDPEQKSSVGTVIGVLLLLGVVAGVAAFGWKCVSLPPCNHVHANRVKYLSICLECWVCLACRQQIASDALWCCRKYQEHKARQYGDYGPMGMDAYGDDGIPLQ